MIKDNYMYFFQRKEPEKFEKYDNKEKSNIVQSNNKKLYNYYVCDNCKEEIKIENKWESNKGGVIVIPAILTKKQAIKLALCHKCINPVLKEFE